MQQQFLESQNQCPELAKWYLFLDGVSDQLTREIVAILSSYCWGVKALGDHVLQARLRDTFAVPVSTKTWNEDVFRDLRASFLDCPDSRASCWCRQKHAMVSLKNSGSGCRPPPSYPPLRDKSLLRRHVLHAQDFGICDFQPLR